MGTTYQTRTRASQNLYRVFLPTLVALSLLASQLVPFAGLLPAAEAAHGDAIDNTEAFEIDGNTVTDTSGDIDWDTAKGVDFLFDELDTAEDVWFKSGKQEQNQGNWEFVRGDVSPAKSDLVRTFATGGFDGGEPHVYFGFEIHDPGNKPTFHGNMEFNQSDQATSYPIAGGGTISLPVRTEGDLNVAVNYSPKGPDVELYRWSGSAWSGPLNASVDADANTGGPIQASSHIGGGTMGVNRFVEVSVSLSEVFGGSGCKAFAQAYAKTRASNPFTANLVDVVEPLDVDIDFCGAVALRKVDALSGEDGPNGLAGAVLALYESDESGTLGDAVITCTTQADGYCPDPDGKLVDLDPGWYTAVELEPPPGYELSGDGPETFELARFETDKEVVFSNPPVDYLIDVDPDGDNAVGNPHDFTVSLAKDYEFDYDDRTFVESSDTPDIPVAGGTIALSWDGPGNVKVWDDAETDWDDIDPVADPSSFTCTTDVDGTCEVRVLSFEPDEGTLTATYDLSGVYQHTVTGSGSQTDGEPLAAVSDTGDKTWYGFEVQLTPPAANNPLGVDHEFTATVWQVAPNGDGPPVKTLASDVDVALIWEAPDGTSDSGILDDGAPPAAAETGSCTTGAQGTCSVTVRSPDGAGTGTLSVTRLDGEVVDGEDLTVDYFTQAEVDEDENLDGPVADATKTWWDYRVDVTPDGINPTDQPHTFKVTVERTSDGTTWGNVPDGTWLELDEFPSNAGGVGEIVSDECSDEDVGTTDGVCYVEVRSDVPGTGTLTVLKIAGTTLPGYDLDEGVEQPFDFVAGGSATKDWASYSLSVDPPQETNLLPGNEDHTFTVTLSSDNEGAAPSANQDVDLVLESEVVDAISVADGSDAGQPVDVEVDEDGTTAFTCTTTEAGTCQVTVTTTAPGAAVLTANFSTEIGGETFSAPEAQGEKLWTTFRVRVTPEEAQNLLGTPHDFTVWVEQTVDGTSWSPVEGAVPTLQVSSPAFVTGSDCDDGTGEDGSCTATVDRASAGTSTLSASYLGQVGEQSSIFSDNGTKQWIDYRVSVDPLEAENLVDTDHVFTVTVERTELGDQWTPVEGAEPTLDLGGVGEISSTTCGAGTDESGECTVTITSQEPGLSTLTATYEGSAGIGEQETETDEFPGSGDKLWVDYLLDVGPAEAINALNDPHVFTVTLQRDDGGEPFTVSGADVDLALSGPGSITAIDDGDVADGARSGTCTTDSDGSCEVTIVSGEPGTAILTASYDAEVGETRATFPASGTKHWAAIQLDKVALLEADEDGIRSVELDEGETTSVTYEYTITNIGPVPLDITSLEDDVLGTIELEQGLRLQPDGTATVTAVGPLSWDEESITNVAMVTGVADDGTEVTDDDAETVFVTFVADVVLEPALTVDKSVISGTTTDADGNEVVDLAEGETATIGYEFLVTNTGDDVLVDLELADDKIGDLTEALRQAAIAEYGVAALPVGGAVVVEADYTTTATDFEAGRVDNVVTADAVGRDSGESVTAEDDASVLIVEVLAEIEVKPAENPLPRTGAETLMLFLYGLLIAALGTAVLLLTRREQHG